MSYRLTATKSENLARDSESGTYFVRAMICGKKYVKTLKTDIFTVAKTRLAEKLKEERARRERLALLSPKADKDTFKGVADAWAASIKAKPEAELKKRAKEYRLDTLKAIRKTWPGIDDLKPHMITEAMVKEWAGKLAKKYSPTRFNGAVETLRAVFAQAMATGVAASNPAMAVERLAVKPKARTLPTEEELGRLLAALASRPDRRKAYLTFRFLMFSGVRPTAGSRILPSDVNLERNEITFPPIKHQSSALTVPMSADLRKVVEELLAASPGKKHPLLPIKSCKKALTTACKEIGIPRITRYVARHMFTTTLIQAGIPMAMVGKLRGDKTIKSTQMMYETYFHPQQQALQQELDKLKPMTMPVPAVKLAPPKPA